MRKPSRRVNEPLIVPRRVRCSSNEYLRMRILRTILADGGDTRPVAKILDLTDDNFGEEPWSYPGRRLPYSAVLFQGTLRKLHCGKNRRIGQSRVSQPDGFSAAALNKFLLEANAASINQRTMVVAVGSNASPVVMHNKFKDKNVSTTIPFIIGSLEGIAVTHSAHVSEKGYIAATPYVAPGAATDVVVAMLDQDQLKWLDKTEPNYQRTAFSSNNFRLTLDEGEMPTTYSIYLSDWEALAGPDGRCIPFTTQEAIFDDVLARSPTLRELVGGPDPRTAMERLAKDDALRLKTRELFKAERLQTSCGFDDIRAATSQRYECIASDWSSPHCESSLRSVPSGDNFRRMGEQCIVVNSTDHQSLLGGATHAAVRTCEEPTVTPALVRVIDSESLNSGTDEARTVEVGTVEVDQIVRYALGLEIQEHVEVVPARAERRPIAERLLTPIVDRLLTRPQFAMLRVQTADLAIVEQGVCLMDELSMRIIGVDEGAAVVIEAAPAGGGAIRTVRLNAHGTSSDTAERRVSLSGGGLESRFPDATDALGIMPDLPWIFLDSASRSKLALDKKKLGTVRVRASRRYQIWKELREISLLVVLALIGIANVIEDPVVIVVAALFFIGCIAWSLRHRLKGKLESTS